MTSRWLFLYFLLGVTCARGVDLELLERSAAPVRRVVLDNGLTVLLSEDHSAPVAAIQVWVGAGSIHEQEWLGGGLSHVVEHMIFKGTPTRPPGEIARQISRTGGDIGAYTGWDRTVFYVEVPSRHWETGLVILADAIFHASFPEEEWQREREVILREFAMIRDDPERQIGRLLWETCFRVHPYRVPVIGYEDVFRTLRRDDVAEFFRRHYTPDNMIVSAVGDFSADEVEAAIRRLFGVVPRRARMPIVLPNEPAQMSPRYQRATGVVAVTRVRLAWPTVALGHSEAPTLDVLAEIVGRGRSSRLKERFVERERLAQDIWAASLTLRDAGLFIIGATCEPANEEALLRALEDEVARWRGEEFSPEEIGRARRQALVDELSSLQTMEGRAQSIAAGEFYTGDPHFSQVYLQRLQAVQAGDLRAAAERYLVPERRSTVILAPTGRADTGERAQMPGPLKMHKYLLTNGLPVIVREDHRLPFVHIVAAIGGGLLANTEPGLTALAAEMLTRGTETRTSAQIAREVEQLGASLSAFSGWNSFGLQGRCLREDLEAFLRLFADCLLNASVPPAELEKQQKLQCAEIQKQLEQPVVVAQKELQPLLFPDHPYQWLPSGTTASVARLSRDLVMDFLRRHVVAGNMVLALFGDITPEEARILAEQHLGAAPAGDRPPWFEGIANPMLPARIVKSATFDQTIILLGCTGLAAPDPRSETLAVIERMLSGLASELGREVRERRGLAYFVGAFHRPGWQPGYFALYAGVREDTVEETERIMREQLARLAEAGPQPEEFDQAIEQEIAEFDMSLQDNGSLALTSALNELFGLGYDYILEKAKRLRSLSASDVRALAAELFRPDRIAVVVVRPQREGEAP